ncbi:Cytosolic Fe-S cluster assembly factor [Trichostrongylus colubriformis]|uniref:Cytosolic Fe-S cluster assembly factor n=1 Tax=Trichostrongylus colubriformis TaxID=6319 RepID=A0AAN8F416_TRICO
MDEGFSGTVRISNISDFIAPSANCIIPLEARVVEEPLVAVRKRQTVKEETKKGAVKISLNDCLACSGCITSAETVLVEEQSITRLLEGMTGKQLSVITVCPQSVCSIAVKRKISVPRAAQLIASYFFSKGAHYVVDSTFGRSFCLEEAYHEFQSRSSRPVLVSSCPGFVCYAEKSHEAFLLPFVSKVRSPQAVTGALVKDYLSRRLRVPVKSIYHAAVMPCFDKKLEASRPDFYVPGTEGVRETDCVISTVEVDSLLDDDISITESEVEGWLGNFSRGFLYGNPGGTSGGFADMLVKRFVSEYGGEVKEERLAKNLEVLTVHRDGDVVLRAARVYGFRNIQNLVRKMKNSKSHYDYVDVQACPNSCGNGGAQIRADTAEEREHILNNVEKAYATIQEDCTRKMREVANEWSALNPDWRKLLYTDYHGVTGNIAQKLQW